LLGGDGQGYLEEVGVGFDAIEPSGEQVLGDSLFAMNWGYLDTPDHAFVAGFDLGLAAETYVSDQATFLIPGARYEATVGFGGFARLLAPWLEHDVLRGSSRRRGARSRGLRGGGSRRRPRLHSCRTRICISGWDSKAQAGCDVFDPWCSCRERVIPAVGRERALRVGVMDCRGIPPSGRA
jgi:hypothetical protein